MQTIGITGATGVLGKRFVNLALERGLKVVVLVRNSTSFADISNSSLTKIEGDLENEYALLKLTQLSDVVFHLAALVGHATEKEYYKVNVDGTSLLCKTILDNKPQIKLVYCSSIAILRRYKKIPVLNTRYTESKYYAQKKVAEYESSGLKVSYVYPGLIYGPGDTKFVPGLTGFLKKGVMLFVRGGEKEAPLIYIDDLCDLFFHTINTPENQALGQHYIGVGPPDLGIHEFISCLGERIGVSTPSYRLPKYLLMPFGVLFEWFYELRGINKMPVLSRRTVDLLSINFPQSLVKKYNKGRWEAKTSVKEGLIKTFKWLDENDIKVNNNVAEQEPTMKMKEHSIQAK